jgi:AcrR family transcriptional regulator
VRSVSDAARVKPSGAAERRTREREDRRRLILEAAARVFLRNGYAATNTNMIADEADIAVGTIYLYFKNKQEILLHLYKDGRERVHRLVAEAAQANDDPLAAIEAMGRAYISHARAHPGFLDVEDHFQQGASVRSLPRKLYDAWMPDIRRIGRETLRIIERKIRDGQSLGLIEPTLDARASANICWAMCSGALRIAASPELVAAAEMESEALVESALGFLLLALRPRARGRIPRRVK